MPAANQNCGKSPQRCKYDTILPPAQRKMVPYIQNYNASYVRNNTAAPVQHINYLYYNPNCSQTDLTK